MTVLSDSVEYSPLRPVFAEFDYRLLHHFDRQPDMMRLAQAPSFVARFFDAVIHENGALEVDGRLSWSGLVSNNYQDFSDTSGSPKSHIEKECAFIGGHTNFGHTVFEDLTRVAVLDLAGKSHLPVAIWKGSQIKRFLELLCRDYIEVEPPCKFTDVIVPSCPVGRDFKLSPYGWPDALWWIRNRFISRSPNLGRLIYLPRLGATHRNVINEKEVAETLTARGFETIDIASISLSQQIELVGSAKVIVIPGGASSPIVAFTRGAVVELMPTEMGNMFGCKIFCATYGLPYARIVGTQEGEAKDANYRVSIDELNATLNHVIGP